MFSEHPILKGTFILTFSGIAGRFVGFFYRIFLSRAIGSEGIGIYQLVFPIYALAGSFTVSGIQTAISRLVSARMAYRNKQGAHTVLLVGLSLSLALSLLAFSILWFFHEPLARIYIREPRTAPLLQILAFAIPFEAFHSCVDAYYYGMKRNSVPAVRQLFEQIIRALTIFLLYWRMQKTNLPLSPAVALAMIVLQECCSALFSAAAITGHFLKKHQRFFRPCKFQGELQELLSLSVPLTTNRMLVSVLQSIEALLLPQCLRLYGYTASEALSRYGVLMGMALPLILFPTAVTSALSTVILPAISEAQMQNQTGRIRSLLRKTCFACFSLGIASWLLLLAGGSLAASLLFHNDLAGTYVRALSWICPLLYLNPALFAVLNGLGQTKCVFYYNLTGLLIRILFLVTAVPHCGVLGFFIGLMANQTAVFLLAMRRLNKLC